MAKKPIGADFQKNNSVLAVKNYYPFSSILISDHTGVSRKDHAPFCERLEVQSLRPTRRGWNAR